MSVGLNYSVFIEFGVFYDGIDMFSAWAVDAGASTAADYQIFNQSRSFVIVGPELCNELISYVAKSYKSGETLQLKPVKNGKITFIGIIWHFSVEKKEYRSKSTSIHWLNKRLLYRIDRNGNA